MDLNFFTKYWYSYFYKDKNSAGAAIALCISLKSSPLSLEKISPILLNIEKKQITNN